MKVFLVNDVDGEGDAYFAASTYKKAWRWIKGMQLNNIIEHQNWGWTQRQLEGFRKHYEDPKELHPYDIQEMEIDSYDSG